MTFSTYYPAPYGVYNNMRVMDRLGVGTTEPEAKLDVRGSIRGDYVDFKNDEYQEASPKNMPPEDTEGRMCYDKEAKLIKYWVGDKWKAMPETLWKYDYSGNESAFTTSTKETKCEIILEPGTWNIIASFEYRCTNSGAGGFYWGQWRLQSIEATSGSQETIVGGIGGDPASYSYWIATGNSNWYGTYGATRIYTVSPGETQNIEMQFSAGDSGNWDIYVRRASLTAVKLD